MVRLIKEYGEPDSCVLCKIRKPSNSNSNTELGLPYVFLKVFPLTEAVDFFIHNFHVTPKVDSD